MLCEWLKRLWPCSFLLCSFWFECNCCNICSSSCVCFCAVSLCNHRNIFPSRTWAWISLCSIVMVFFCIRVWNCVMVPCCGHYLANPTPFALPTWLTSFTFSFFYSCIECGRFWGIPPKTASLEKCLWVPVKVPQESLSSSGNTFLFVDKKQTLFIPWTTVRSGLFSIWARSNENLNTHWWF